MTNTRSVLVLIVGALSLGALSGPATASTQRTSDPVADVMRVTGASGDDRCGAACEAFERPEVDVRGWRSTYDDSALRMSATVGRVAPGVVVAWRVAGSGTAFTVSLRNAPSGLTCAIYRPDDGYRNPDPCDGVEYFLDGAARTYRVTVAARLLGGAPSVRTGVGAWRRAGDYTYIDDGTRERFNPYRVKVFPHLGPSVTRG
jgi:hypothetical protein